MRAMSVYGRVAALLLTVLLGGCDMWPGAGFVSGSAESVQVEGSGFFADEQGHILTARHVVARCGAPYVRKGSRLYRAELVHISEEFDIALLALDKTRGLSAVFTARPGAAANEAAFAASYAELPGIIHTGGAWSNAVIADGAGAGSANMTLVSRAAEGASGAPVLNSKGLVAGMVTHRLTGDKILAVKAETIKAYLAAQGISYLQDSRPQLSAFQDRARRAATLSVGILCYEGR